MDFWSAGKKKSGRCGEVAVSRGSTVSLSYICISSFSNLGDCKTNIRSLFIQLPRLRNVSDSIVSYNPIMLGRALSTQATTFLSKVSQ